MPQRFFRLLISFLILVHLTMVTLAITAHRGISYLHDDALSLIAPYAVFGNWKVDINRLPIASAGQLAEIVRIELHPRGASADGWKQYSGLEHSEIGKKRSQLSRDQRLEQHWLQQISGLLLYDNDEGVGQMLAAAMPLNGSLRVADFDKVRITVAPRLSLEQYSEQLDSDRPTELAEALKPQVAYLASIIDLGEGQITLLRQMDERRASKSIEPTRPSAPDGAKRP